MKLAGINEIAAFLGVTRDTARKKLAALQWEDGPRNAKLYDSAKAARLIFGAGSTGEGQTIDYAEAQRLLTVKRGEQIDLEMEVTRKDRIPLDVVESINEEAFSNFAGMLKANEGKTLTALHIKDMLTELRRIGAAIADGRNQ